MWTHGHFYWNELMTPDVGKAKDFYAKTLGWTYEDMAMPDGTYFVIREGSPVPIGGMTALPKDVRRVAGRGRNRDEAGFLYPRLWP